MSVVLVFDSVASDSVAFNSVAFDSVPLQRISMILYNRRYIKTVKTNAYLLFNV